MILNGGQMLDRRVHVSRFGVSIWREHVSFQLIEYSY